VVAALEALERQVQTFPVEALKGLHNAHVEPAAAPYAVQISDLSDWLSKFKADWVNARETIDATSR
jgi:hypothetical protein